MTLIAQPPNGTDPIIFLQGLLENWITDEKGNHIPIQTAYAKKINDIPRVVINQKPESMRFISIPAVRRRWNTPFSVEVWAKSVKQRYAIKQSMMARLDMLGGPTTQLAANYVYTWYKVHAPVDDVRTFGQPIFKINFDVELIYDILITQEAQP